MTPLTTTPSRKTHVRHAGLVALIALLAVVAAAPGTAANARHVTIEIHDSFVDGFLSDVCNTEVVISMDATLDVTLVYNRAGLIVKEVDPSGGGTNTFSAPATGKSFSFPFATVIIDYGAGAAVGTPFTFTQFGLLGHVPGLIPSDAGRRTFSGFVDGFDEHGLPNLNFTGFEFEHGNRESGQDIRAAICAALTA
jgi:hypothetical protein